MSIIELFSSVSLTTPSHPFNGQDTMLTVLLTLKLLAIFTLVSVFSSKNFNLSICLSGIGVANFLILCLSWFLIWQRYTLFFEKQNIFLYFLFYFDFISFPICICLNIRYLCINGAMVAERFANLEFLERVAILEG